MKVYVLFPTLYEAFNIKCCRELKNKLPAEAVLPRRLLLAIKVSYQVLISPFRCILHIP